MQKTISDITLEDVASYLRIDDVEPVTTELQMAMGASLAFIVKRTGRSETYVRSQPDLAYSYLGLIAEMYENRQLTVKGTWFKNDLILDAIDAHAVNLLPGEAELAESEDGDSNDAGGTA